MVLSNTIKRQVGRTPLKVFEHELAKRNIPVHLPLSDEHAVDEGVAAGKVLFSTFHQSKGLERRVVFVFGFSNDYFVYAAKDANPM